MPVLENEGAIMGKARKPKKLKRDETREERISMEIVVDAYDEEERAMGRYYYLEDKLTFPFLTRCISERAISPLRVGDEVEVVGMAPEDECEREMFVETHWEHGRTLAVPLSQLKVVHGDDETQQAVDDWHYWVEMGYEV
jgi:Calcium binding